MHDLLQEPLITIRTTAGPARVSLPDLLARLYDGSVDAYMGVRPHQADPFHVFLVQIAASISARRNAVGVKDAQYWKEGLLDLAEGEPGAWHLVQPDPTKPAFLQHPLVGAAEQASLKVKATTPDELDVLVTAKDHDVKMARAAAGDMEAWFYALLVYQTTSGVLGARSYGIVRMNRGYGNRPVVSIVSSLQPGRRFREELDIVCALRAATVSRYKYRDRGTVLSWLTPWNRENHQHVITDLEPWFIEAARPLRLVNRADAIFALGGTSNARQIGPKTIESGDVGDPWIPVNVADAKKGRSALTLSASGWTPERLAKLLFEQDFEMTPLQRPRPGSGDVWMTGSALVRGQGTTDGFHKFELRIPAATVKLLLSSGGAHSLGAFSIELLKDARESAKAVGLALMVLAEGGPDTANVKNDTVARWVQSARDQFGRTWEDEFFPTLWAAVDVDRRTEVRDGWRQRLVRSAERVVGEAERSLPLPSARRYRAVVRAEGALRGSLRKAGVLPEFSRDHEEEIADD